MRKIILFNLMSLDGFFEGPGRDIGWHNVDEEFERFSIQQLDSAGGLLFGRVTYELMAGFWPSEEARASEPATAARMNNLPKYVFSRTLECVEWNNSFLITAGAAEGTRRLKSLPGKDLFLFGSADLAATLALEGLIDEYRLLLNPVTLGRGTPLFKDGGRGMKFALLDTRVFGNGNVLLTYQPAGSA